MVDAATHATERRMNMGVYIPNMEMPTRCPECPCAYWTEGAHYDYCQAKGYSKESEIFDSDQRPKWCPLIEIPPHGRLIDADALRQSIKESVDECHKWADEVEGGEMYARGSQSLGTFVECSLRVKAAPTIIPAEEGE